MIARLEGPVIPRQSPETWNKPYFSSCGVGAARKLCQVHYQRPQLTPLALSAVSPALLCVLLANTFKPCSAPCHRHLFLYHTQSLLLSLCPKHSTGKLDPSVSISLCTIVPCQPRCTSTLQYLSASNTVTIPSADDISNKTK